MSENYDVDLGSCTGGLYRTFKSNDLNQFTTL